MDWFKDSRKSQQRGILKVLRRKVLNRFYGPAVARKYDGIEDNELELISIILESLINQEDPRVALNLSKRERHSHLSFNDNSKGEIDKRACVAVHILTEVKGLSNIEAYETITLNSKIPKTAKAFGDCHNIPKYNKGKKELSRIFEPNKDDIARNIFLGTVNGISNKESTDVKLYREVISDYESSLIRDPENKAKALSRFLYFFVTPIERSNGTLEDMQQNISKTFKDEYEITANDIDKYERILDGCYFCLSDYYNRKSNKRKI